MKVIVKRIPCRKKPAPDAAEQAKADACNANVVCIPIDMKRMLRNAKLSKGFTEQMRQASGICMTGMTLSRRCWKPRKH